MSNDAANRYDFAMIALLISRANGSNTEELEVELAEHMDQAWSEMTKGEQAKMNKKCEDVLRKAGVLDIV